MFTFKDGIGKFVWMNLPEVSGFTVSYRLIPTATQTIEGLKINGKLSYILEGKTIDVQIEQKDIDLSGVTNQNVAEIVAAINRGETLPTEKPVAITEEITPPPPVTDKPPPPPAKESSTAPRTGSSSRIPATQLLAVQDGLYFRVQLAATRRFRDVNLSFNEYNLSRPVKVESHEGWYKYTAGSFGSYKQAGDFRNGMESKGIIGAFVVSYRNGTRIDIMDALQSTGGQ
jgi:hypothetical protein